MQTIAKVKICAYSQRIRDCVHKIVSTLELCLYLTSNQFINSGFVPGTLEIAKLKIKGNSGFIFFFN